MTIVGQVSFDYSELGFGNLKNTSDSLYISNDETKSTSFSQETQILDIDKLEILEHIRSRVKVKEYDFSLQQPRSILPIARTHGQPR